MEQLAKEVTQAKLLDENERLALEEKHKGDFEEWENDRSLAKRLLAGEEAAILEVITELQTLNKTDLIGSSVQFSISDNYVHARPQVHTDEIVPSFRRKQLAVTSRQVVRLFFEQLWFEFVPVFHGLQGRLAAQG